MSRKIRRILAVTVLAALITAASAFAGKPSSSSSSPTLSVSFPSLAGTSLTSGGMAYGTSFVVSGCGYGSTYTSVVVTSPEALSFAGQAPDANGCISFDNFSTNLAGPYRVDAYQQDPHGHGRVVASTSFGIS
jgi:hypothetical protein